MAVVLVGGLVLLIAGLAFAYSELKRPSDVNNESVPFKAEPPPKKAKPKAKTVNWPTFRLNNQRTGYLAAKKIKPPFKRVWSYGDQPLLEFPPAVVRDALYFVDNDGYAHALKTKNGHVIWERKIASLNASTPTYSDGVLYIVNLEPGQIIALKAKSGRQIWKKSLPCRSESSPVVVRKTVYFGCENSNLYALKAKTGREVWSTGVSGAIKGAPAYENGILFVGDYGGAMTAIHATNGRIKWQSQSLGPGLGQPGTFYSTPAVAYGRVYIGNNDGRVYSFDAETGEVAWTFSTGDYVYSGPTVAKVPGTPPTVYIGSFDRNVYALDARTGKARWTYDMGGRVIGSLSVINKLVYASTFDGTSTYGISAKTGQKKYFFHSGAYMPAVSDGEKLYLTGYSGINAMKPVTEKELKAARKAKAKKAAAKKKKQKQEKKKRAEKQKKQKKKQAQKAKQGKKKSQPASKNE
ncbi:MAG: PQQ-binding-like beta-propeller repeat protein [Solirubrobacterales bacterium]|nr:PQQ-binding-like beta-propeller repeat protein [Solirubrobacterales bacterium]